MHKRNQFEEFDLKKLLNALRLLKEVYNYYYDFPPMRRKNNRLETIIKKLETLLDMD